MGLDRESPPSHQSTTAVDDEYWMQQALRCARHAEGQGEVPIGAVLVRDGQQLAEGWNQPISDNDPTAHAEIMTLRSAAQTVGNYRLNEAVLYVTLEPCTMCAGAIVHARLATVVFGASDPRAGAAGSQFNLLQHPSFNHQVEIRAGVLADECSQLLRTFFERRRSNS